MKVEWTTFRSPVGPLVLVECPDGPLVVEFPVRAARLNWADRLRIRPVMIEPGPCRATATWLEAYFAGSREPFPFPEYLIQWMDPDGPSLRVWRYLTAIPYGETRAYEDVALATGQHPRQVGRLNGANHLAILIPCHRVVGKDGGLVGYGGGVAKKRWLLDHELRSAGVMLR